MTVIVYLAIYSGLLIFLLGSAWRAWTYAHLPVHLRWELYPVPHEEPRRARYGGSYFEEQEWSRKPQHRNFFGEVGVMAEEILLLKGVRDHNRRLWLPSYYFHFGIYLAMAAALLAIGGVLLPWLSGIAEVVLLVGATLIVVGASLLLKRRLFSLELRNSTRPGDIFNLVFFLAAFVLLIAGMLLREPQASPWTELARGLLHFDTSIHIGSFLACGLILASALAAYIPFTHMAHFVAKYFTWHEVRWDDRRSQAGSAMEREVGKYLAAKPNWAAPHIGANGERSWAEIATQPVEEVRK